MSREDHRQYDAALQKLRAEAEAIQKQAPKFKWQDSLTLVGVLLTVTAFIYSYLRIRRMSLDVSWRRHF